MVVVVERIRAPRDSNLCRVSDRAQGKSGKQVVFTGHTTPGSENETVTGEQFAMTALPSNIIHLGAHRTQISCGSEMSLPSRSLGMRDKKDQAPIQLADHRPSSPIDERLNSERLTAARLFILDDEQSYVREFAA
jgi:hypothetical protein